MIEVKPSGQACGATVTGLDLARPLDAATLREVRAAWLEHHVLAFPDQTLSDADLERIAQSFGVFGSEPYFGTIEGSEHVVALTRKADEKAPAVRGELAFRLEFYGRAAHRYLPVQSRHSAGRRRHRVYQPAKSAGGNARCAARQNRGAHGSALGGSGLCARWHVRGKGQGGGSQYGYSLFGGRQGSAWPPVYPQAS